MGTARTESSGWGRVVTVWFRGWERFAEAAGGRAEDLVGASPWRRGKSQPEQELEVATDQGVEGLHAAD